MLLNELMKLLLAVNVLMPVENCPRFIHPIFLVTIYGMPFRKFTLNILNECLNILNENGLTGDIFRMGLSAST